MHRAVLCRVLGWALVLACAAWFVVLQSGSSTFERWLAAAVLILVVVATLAATARELPLQSTLTAAGMTALISGVILAVNARTGIPFGPVAFSDNAGLRIFGVLPCALPFLWMVVILNSRGVARVMVLGCRNLSNPGLWTIGIAGLLAVIMDFNLEPFAVNVGRFWIWRTSSETPAWQTAPMLNYLGWFYTTVLVLVAIVPWVVKKRPAPVDHRNFHPLWLWLATNLFLVSANAMHNLRTIAAVGLLASLAVVAMALRRKP